MAGADTPEPPRPRPRAAVPVARNVRRSRLGAAIAELVMAGLGPQQKQSEKNLFRRTRSLIASSPGHAALSHSHDPARHSAEKADMAQAAKGSRHDSHLAPLAGATLG